MTHSITIIGAGASGTLLAVQLARQARQPLTVYLVEQHAVMGRGVAYGTTTPAHRLNVPANKMGAYPDQPGHFHDWLLQNGHDFAPDAFVPRQLYAIYLQAQLQAAVASGSIEIELVHDEAIDVEIGEQAAVATQDSSLRGAGLPAHEAIPESVLTTLASGRVLTSDAAVLAFGNFLPPQPGFLTPQAAAAPKYFNNPWLPDLASRIGVQDRVLVIGMGLTGVDTLLSLQGQQHAGPLYAISTHGWWPAAHQLGYSYPDFSAELTGLTSLPAMLRIIRRHLQAAAEQGSNWRAVIDALRPSTQTLWQQLPPAEKRRFMRHLRRLWDVSRHRMPQECAAALDAMHASGQLRSLQGRITAIEFDGAAFNVTYRSHSGGHTLQADAVINCMGSETRLARLPSRLMQNLLARQTIQADDLAQGIHAAPDGAIAPRLYTLGTALKGVLWESTAMPEIRTQAQQLAARLLAA
ncbi:MAG: FAD/NAD(P)-binding protein [Anaerolineales bacterium]|nr:MAG: FAD/NAD(P)-binding protein [Anaerolineales bacterium]